MCLKTITIQGRKTKMPKRQIFYSFHYANDVMRVQQIRNIGALEDNKPVAPNVWEEVRRRGDAGIKKWIDDNMAYRSCVVVLVGGETAYRPWVQHEIRKAWEDGKGLLGIYIHNLKCPRNGFCRKGPNPFDQFTLQSGLRLSSIVDCHDPFYLNAYSDISNNMGTWVEQAIAKRG
jgi:hypothetical protein